MKNGPQCKTRKREEAIETDLRFCGQRKTLMNRPSKSYPKARFSIRHKSLYAMKNGLSYKTRKRAEDQ